MDIWVYNLTTFAINKEEVDYIKDGKAVRKRTEGGHEVNTKVFNKFGLTKSDAEQFVKDYLKKEILAREERMQPLRDAYNKLCE